MVKTRHQRSNLIQKTAKRRQERELITPSARAERLAITKAIAREIVSTQEDLGGGRHGCRMDIIRRYSQIYSWLKKDQVDWHVKQIRKQRQSISTLSNDYTNINTNINSKVNSNLVVNDSTIESNDTTVSFQFCEVDCWGGEGTSILDVPRPRRIIHLGLATSRPKLI